MNADAGNTHLDNRNGDHWCSWNTSKCREAAGVPYFSPHKFRFYGASQMYRAGVPMNTLRYYLGHSTLAMTEHKKSPRILILRLSRNRSGGIRTRDLRLPKTAL